MNTSHLKVAAGPALLGVAFAALLFSSAESPQSVSAEETSAFNSEYFEVVDTKKPENADTTIRWMIGHLPEHYFVQAARTFKKELEERTNGEMTVEIITFKDGIERETVEKLQLRQKSKELLKEGEVDMMQAFTEGLTRIEPRLTALQAPLVFEDYEHVDMAVDGKIGKELLSGFEGSPYEALAFTFSGGFLSFFSNTAEIDELADLQGKTTYRKGPITNQLYEELGLEPIVHYTEDGEHNTADIERSIYGDFFIEGAEEYSDEAQKSFLHSRHAVLFTVLLMNDDLFEGLTASQQEAVKTAAKEAAQKEREEVKKDEEELLSGQDKDWVHNLSAEDKEKLERVAEEVKDSLSEENKNVVQQIEVLR